MYNIMFHNYTNNNDNNLRVLFFLLLLASALSLLIPVLLPSSSSADAGGSTQLVAVRRRGGGQEGYYHATTTTINATTNAANITASTTTERHRRHLQRFPDYRNPNKGSKLPTTGKFRGLVLLVTFPEDVDKRTAPLEYLEEVFNGVGKSSVNPAGSIREWLLTNSLGRYEVERYDIMNWTLAPHSAKHYAQNVSGRLPHKVLEDIFSWKLDEMDNDGHDFSPYDSNGDNILDHLIILHSGYTAEVGRVPCHDMFLERLWGSGIGYPGKYRTPNSKYRIGSWAMASGIGVKQMCKEPTPYFEMGLLMHEVSKMVYAQDMYDFDTTDDDPILIGGVGSFSIMSNPFGWRRKPVFPGHLDPYSRMGAGWLDPVVIQENGYYSIQPSEISGVVYKIDEGYPDGEFLLIENRQGLKWDADWTGTGIVIWHIDEDAPGQTARGYPGHANWPAEHYMVAVEQADGLYELEQGMSLGDPGDFWVKDMVLGPNEDGNTWPNTDSYQGGNVQQTGVKITIMSDNGFVMFFKVEGLPDGGVGGDGVFSSTNFAPESKYIPVDPSSSYNGGSDDNGGQQQQQQSHHPGNSTGRTVTWVLSILGGVSAMLGVLAFFYVA